MVLGAASTEVIHPPLLLASKTLKGVERAASLVPTILAEAATLSLSRLPFITAEIVLKGVFTSAASIVCPSDGSDKLIVPMTLSSQS